MIGRPLGIAVLAGLLTSAPSSAAHAHLISTGLGPVYDGVLHLVLSPEDLVPAFAMALLAGSNGAGAARWATFVLPISWLGGGIGGFVAHQPPIPDAAAVASFLVLGGLIALGRPLRPAVVGALACALGLVHGCLNGAGLALAGREAVGLAGTVGAVFVLFPIVAALVVSQRAGWTRIAVRVAGSWVLAVGLLMLGWQARVA